MEEKNLSSAFKVRHFKPVNLLHQAAVGVELKHSNKRIVQRNPDWDQKT